MIEGLLIAYFFLFFLHPRIA